MRKKQYDLCKTSVKLYGVVTLMCIPFKQVILFLIDVLLN